ncbi:MAG TPA: VOC family protein [Acetobacteraceae bacterium]|nr:VOC family protein [Acetobacteraceae bacterium]
MVRVVGIDHLVIRVSDYETSKDFYGKLFTFLGFEILDEYPNAIGWTNGKTRFWIGPADAEGRVNPYRIGDVGFHHYAFQLRSRRDVDALQEFLRENGINIVDPAGEYYDDYYAVFFTDPDGLKFEGMKYGEHHEREARAQARKHAANLARRTVKKKAAASTTLERSGV